MQQMWLREEKRKSRAVAANIARHRGHTPGAGITKKRAPKDALCRKSPKFGGTKPSAAPPRSGLASNLKNISIMTDNELMRMAIRLASDNIDHGGGPFGAVIARGGEVIATGVNRVTAHNDPTAHAEVCAIREAARRLGTFDLSGCTIYASCEPCPMCLGAIYWAHLDRLVYAGTQHDAAAAGFDDSYIYAELRLPAGLRHLPSLHTLRDEAAAVFTKWGAKQEKTPY